MTSKILIICSFVLVVCLHPLFADPNLQLVKFPGSVFLVSEDQCGIVDQKDRESGKLLRKIRFYRVFPGTETWFTDFFRSGDEIWARDDKGRIYKMEAKTLKPKRVELTESEFTAKKPKVLPVTGL